MGVTKVQVAQPPVDPPELPDDAAVPVLPVEAAVLPLVIPVEEAPELPVDAALDPLVLVAVPAPELPELVCVPLEPDADVPELDALLEAEALGGVDAPDDWSLAFCCEYTKLQPESSARAASARARIRSSPPSRPRRRRRSAGR